jgi:sugar (pentulose or hexulose) kinase
MIQFLGLDLSPEAARAVALGRNLELSVEVSTPVAGARRDPDGPGVSIPPAEWLRAGGFALQETYLELPVAARKLWGIGLSGPAGWVALDPEYRPLSDVRVVPAASVLADLASWLEHTPRLRARVAAVLPPKDYFRFATSRALATDVTTVAAMGLCALDACDWDREAAAASRVDRRWLPPVFESSLATGRLDEEGMRQTGLPGSLWLVAGALSQACAMVAAGDLRRGVLWAPPRAQCLTVGLGDAPYVASTQLLATPGWTLRRAPFSGHALLERRATGGEQEIDEARRELARAGIDVREVSSKPGRAEVGAAALAAVGSGLVKSWDWFYAQASR